MPPTRSDASTIIEKCNAKLEMKYDEMIDFCNSDGDLKVVKFHYFTVEKISKKRMIGYFSLLLKIPTTGYCNTGFIFIVSTGVNK